MKSDWRTLLAGCLLTAALLAGCGPEEMPLHTESPPPEADGSPLRPLTPGEKPPTEDYLLVVRYSLTILEVPAGSVSRSEDLWSYLNEEPTAGRIGPTLAYNGVRVGIGGRQAWREISKLLKVLSGKPVVRRNLISQSGAEVPIILRRQLPEQTIFLYRPDRTLVGQDYPPADNVLMLSAAINVDDPSSVLLTGTPVVRSTRRKQRYVERPEGYVLVNEPEYFPLPDCSFRLRIRAGDFVVFGPGASAKRKSSPGNAFLVTREDGVAYEKVVVIAPEVFAAPIRGAG